MLTTAKTKKNNKKNPTCLLTEPLLPSQNSMKSLLSSAQLSF